MNFATVKQRVRSIIGDPDGDFLTDAYLGPMVNHVYGLEVLYLRNAGALNIEKVQIIADLPAGKSDLSEYQRMPQKPGDIRPLFGTASALQVGRAVEADGNTRFVLSPGTDGGISSRLQLQHPLPDLDAVLRVARLRFLADTVQLQY